MNRNLKSEASTIQSTRFSDISWCSTVSIDSESFSKYSNSLLNLVIQSSFPNQDLLTKGGKSTLKSRNRSENKMGLKKETIQKNTFII